MDEEIVMPHIIHKGKKLIYTLNITKRRKSICLRVDRNSNVVVSAPKFFNKSVLQKFVQKKADWIVDKQKTFQNFMQMYPPKEFRSGETFPLLGRKYRLMVARVVDIKQPYCKLEDGRLKVFVDGQTGYELDEVVKDLVRECYISVTEKKVNAIICRHVGTLAVMPGKVSVVEQKKRWGSCSKKGNLRFNWRLSAMPVPVIEYIVVHELCHLKALDHSERFWRILKSVLPNHEKYRQWLRENGLQFSLMLA